MSHINKLNSKFKNTLLNRTFLLSVSTLILGTVLALGMQIILAALQGPTAPPPGGVAGTTFFINTSANSQIKKGSLQIGNIDYPTSGLIVKGDVSIGGTTYGKAGQEYKEAYFKDVYLGAPLTGGQARWASDTSVPFTGNCQWVAGGNCTQVALNLDPNIQGELTGTDEYYYIVRQTDFTNNRVYCCRPPKAPPVVEKFQVVIDEGSSSLSDPSVTCSGGYNNFQATAYIFIKDTVGTPAPNMKVGGSWSGATTKCEDGIKTFCTGVTDSTGMVTIKSFQVPNAYGKQFTFTVTSVTAVSGGGYFPGTPNFSMSKTVPNLTDGAYTKVGSVTVIHTDNEPPYQYIAKAIVKVVNGVGSPIQQIAITGRWGNIGGCVESYCKESSTGTAGTTNEKGEAIITMPESVYSWNVKPFDPNNPNIKPKITFTVLYVNPGQCDPWDGVSKTGTLYVIYIKAPSMTGWIFDGSQKYAWGENIGWLNFQPSRGGVLAFDNCLEGYVWAENIGWVNLGNGNPKGLGSCLYVVGGYSNTSSTDFGVNNDGYGNLSGYGWAENAGWINFSGVRIVRVNETKGRFSGYAWGENVGWINFGHTQTNYVPVVIDATQ